MGEVRTKPIDVSAGCRKDKPVTRNTRRSVHGIFIVKSYIKVSRAVLCILFHTLLYLYTSIFRKLEYTGKVNCLGLNYLGLPTKPNDQYQLPQVVTDELQNLLEVAG